MQCQQRYRQLRKFPPDVFRDNRKKEFSLLTKGTRTAIILWRLKFATVAQLVEQRIRNAQVVGSSPTSSSILKKTGCY